MTEGTATPAKSPKKKTATKPKPAVHPKYVEMVAKAVTALKERGGSSRQAILKYILANFNVGTDAKVVNTHLKIALRNGVKNKSLKQSKGTGASGSFKVGEVPKPAKKKPVKKAVKPKAAKPKAAKPKTAKPKKATTPKKKTTTKKTATKKAATKQPAGEKKTAKPKASKPAAKKTATKKPAAAKKATKSPKKTKPAAKPKKAKTPKKK